LKPKICNFSIFEDRKLIPVYVYVYDFSLQLLLNSSGSVGENVSSFKNLWNKKANLWKQEVSSL